jgi:hypothetical protein
VGLRTGLNKKDESKKNILTKNRPTKLYPPAVESQYYLHSYGPLTVHALHVTWKRNALLHFAHLNILSRISFSLKDTLGIEVCEGGGSEAITDS